MIKGIISTGFSRVISAIISLIIIVLNARSVGADGIAIIGLVVLAVSILSLFGGMLGGASLAYFTPRARLSYLIYIAFFGSMVVPVFFYIIYFIINNLLGLNFDLLIPNGFGFQVFILSFLQIIYSNFNSILVGRKKIYAQNLNTITQAIILVFVTLFSYEILGLKGVNMFFIALAASFVVPAFMAFNAIRKLDKNEGVKDPSIIQMIKFSITVQLASLFQLLNYRLSYYLVKHFLGISKLGVFTVGNQLSEGVWIFPKSVALVQFGEISNSSNRAKNINITITLLALVIMATSIAVFVLVAIPETTYLRIFGGVGFIGIKSVIIWLSPGIIFLSANMILSHYFSGSGKPSVNLTSSFVGFLVIVLAGFYFVPNHGIVGAAISSSLSYLVSLMFTLSFFVIEIGKIPNFKLIRPLTLLEMWNLVRVKIVGRKK